MTAVVAGRQQGGPLRPRIIAAAVELTAARGWSSVTMARLADAVGVSRQTVYNEIGSKPALAESMILEELGRFLSIVEHAFDRHPTNLSRSIHDAALGVLELAQDNALLHAIVSATHGAGTELLPLLTTHAGSLLQTAKTVVAERLAPIELPFSGAELDALIDTIVRLVLSHVMQPTASPARTADDIAWISARVLRPEA